ncbi:MAG: L-ribulose-5-phosphate 4-epimerase [Clostridia bacterium]|nr:L-ribulose-5-phosphate 4-epimerase [Clostridia bacterium]
MLTELKKQVYEANMAIQRHKLAIFTWGNVSGIDRSKGLVVIKPSGVEYDALSPIDLPVIDVATGRVVEGDLNPSSDTPTHLEIYRRFKDVGGVTHTHSEWATIYAQAGRSIRPYGTTHADYFGGEIPCTRPMTAEEITGKYELETGRVICETFEKLNIDPMHIPAVLVHSHGPFTWGKDAMKSVETAITLDYVARLAYYTESLTGIQNKPNMDNTLLHKHFDRKHGKNAYYGQKRK